MVEHSTDVQIRWSDVDPAGIVFYPRFFEWYDLGCEALFESLGLPWPEAFPKYDIVGVPIVESGSKFLSPARYGDVLTIRSKVAWVKTKTFRMEHEISVGARLCSQGFAEPPMYTRAAPPARHAYRGAGGQPHVSLARSRVGRPARHAQGRDRRAD